MTWGVGGVITITPPLSRDDFTLSPFLPTDLNGGSGGTGLVLVIDRENWTATGITPRYDETSDPDELADELQRIIDDRPGHQYTGRLELMDFGEEARINVVAGQAVVHKPSIVWEPDSE